MRVFYIFLMHTVAFQLNGKLGQLALTPFLLDFLHAALRVTVTVVGGPLTRGGHVSQYLRLTLSSLSKLSGYYIKSSDSALV